MEKYFGELYLKTNDNFFSFLIRCEKEYKNVKFFICNESIKKVLIDSVERSLAPPRINDDDNFQIEYRIPRITSTRKFTFNSFLWSDILFVVNSKSKFSANLKVFTKRIIIDFGGDGNISVSPIGNVPNLDDYIKDTSESLRVKIYR